MENDALIDSFLPYWEMLHHYFTNKLKKYNIKENGIEIRETLIDLTGERVIRYLKSNKYPTLKYKLDQIVRSNAEHVWFEYINSIIISQE
jgi:hypothetical protein